MSGKIREKAEKIVDNVDIPGYVDYFGEEELVNGVESCMSENPDVLSSKTASVVNAVQNSVDAGLLLGNGLDFAYLSPEFGGDGCQFMYGWRGIKFSSLHYGNAEHIRADVVKSNDDFEGLDRSKPGWDQLQHKLATDFRGNALGYYGAIELDNGFVEIEYMSLAEDIVQHLVNTKSNKKRLNDAQQFAKDVKDFVQGDSEKSISQILGSHGFGKHDTWVKWFDLMARKTVLSRAARRHVNFDPQVSSAIKVADENEGKLMKKNASSEEDDATEEKFESKTDQLKDEVGIEQGEKSDPPSEEPAPNPSSNNPPQGGSKEWRQKAKDMGMDSTDIQRVAEAVTENIDAEPQSSGWYKYLNNKLEKMKNEPSYFNEMVDKHNLDLGKRESIKDYEDDDETSEGEDVEEEDQAFCVECEDPVPDEDIVEESMKKHGKVICPDCEEEQGNCSDCGEEVAEKVKEFSVDVYGEPVCQGCQKKR